MSFTRQLPVLLTSAFLCFSLAACNGDDDNGMGNSGSGGGDAGSGGSGGSGSSGALESIDSLNMIDLGSDGNDIVDLDPNSVNSLVTDVFSRYTAITTPSGDRIQIVAQSGVTDAQIFRTREILRMHLEDIPGTNAGASKTDVADTISANSGTMALFRNSASFDANDPAVMAFANDFGDAFVPLFGDTIVVEGSPEYIAASPAIDETIGATGVLVYRQGLLTERTALTNELQLAAANAEADGTYSPNGPEPYLDTDELFVATVLNSHAGIYAHDPSGDGSARDGVYAFGSRSAIEAGDLSTFEAIEDFFATSQTFEAEIDPGFSGTFQMIPQSNLAYTNRSQYLTNARLTGNNPSELFGSSASDRLTGNSANNRLNGRSGDDFIDGGAGLDSAVFNAPRDQFDIINNGDGTFTVRHNVTPGLGEDTLTNIENAVFPNGMTIAL